MREAHHKAIVLAHWHDRHRLMNLGHHRQGIDLGPTVQGQVGERELDLSQQRHRPLKLTIGHQAGAQ